MDYQELYFKMMRATEEAIRILIKAQQECEELYLSATDGEEPSAEGGDPRGRG